jgi:hypothetical protein
MLTLLVPLGAFQPPKPAPGGPTTLFPWGREQELLASCGYIYILGMQARGRKGPNSKGKISIAGVLRLRATERCVTR